MTITKDVVVYQVGDDSKQRAHASWHRGDHCFFHPSFTNLKESDSIKRYLMDGIVPPSPIISPESRILSVGSCFARSIANYLRAKSIKVNTGPKDTNIGLLFQSSGFVTSIAIRHHIEWALGKREIKEYTMYAENKTSLHRRGVGPKGKRITLLPADKHAREMTKKAITSSNVFIFTFGLSELWYHLESGEPYMKAVPEELFNPDKHGFRVIGPDENKLHIKGIVELIRSFAPKAPIVLTLSPVPLTATFRNMPCMVASSASKAHLRSALDMAIQDLDDDLVFYLPSYEIVVDHIGKRRALKDDCRHVKPEIVDLIMRCFDQTFMLPA